MAKRLRAVGEMAKWDAFFAGMGDIAKDRAEARAITEGEELTAKLLEPAGDVSRKAGRMERDAPLFYGTGENPLLF